MHNFKIFQDARFHYSQLFFWAKDANGTTVYVEEDPIPGNKYMHVHILFYGVGLGITILLMYLGLKSWIF